MKMKKEVVQKVKLKFKMCNPSTLPHSERLARNLVRFAPLLDNLKKYDDDKLPVKK
jgi:hypothetical protein